MPAPVRPSIRLAEAPASAGLLAEITAGLAAGSDLHELLARFLHPIVDIAGAAAGAVRVLDEPRGGMVLVASLGLPGEVLDAERVVEGGCGACGSAAAGDQPVWTDDLGPCAVRHAGGAFFGAGCRRILAVPLAHRARRLGVYTLFYPGVAAPSAEVFALLKSVGDLLGLALDNARLERENLRSTILAERQALAADVHDSIGQQLTFVKMRLPLLADAIASGSRADAERYFEDVRSTVGEAHTSLRGLLTQWRVPADPLGLAHAVDASVQAFRRSSGTELEVRNAMPQLRMAPEHEAQVAYIVQEALANIARHAGARHAWLTISPLPGGAVQVLVEDDGAGLRAATSDDDAGHYGLAIMRDRARRLSGTLQLGPRGGGGTTVRLVFPCPRAAAGVPEAAPARAEVH